MAKVGNIFVEMGLDYRNLAQGLAWSTRQLAAFGRQSIPMPSFGGVFTGMAAFEGVKAGLSGAAGALSSIKNFMDHSANSASDLNETLSKTNVLLGQNAAEVIRFANELQSKGAAGAKDTLEAISSTVTALTNQGMGQDQAISIAKQLQQRFVDLASQDNARVEDVQNAFQSLLAGQIEPLRNFKIFTNVEDLKKSGLPFGQAAAEAFLKQSARAAGDFGNTRLSLSNLQRSNEIQRGAVSQQVGQSLQPAYQAAAWFQNQFLEKFSSIITGKLSGAGDAIFSGVSAIGQAILDNTPLIADAFIGVANFIGSAMSTIGSVIRSPAEYLRLALLETAFAITDFARKILPNAFNDTRKTLSEGISTSQKKIAENDANAATANAGLRKMLEEGSQGKAPTQTTTAGNAPRPDAAPTMARAATARTSSFADFLKGIYAPAGENTPQGKQLAVSQSMDEKLGTIAKALTEGTPGVKPIGAAVNTLGI